MEQRNEAMTRRLRTVCGWCDKDLGGPKEGPVSHGMCRRCRDRALREAGLTPPPDPWQLWRDEGGEG